MLRSLKIILWIGLMAVGAQSGWAFALLGPIGNAGDAWQTPVIGYGIGFDIGSPKALGEEYRVNKRVMYYSCDQNFLDFFGSDGVIAVDQAFTIVNSLTNVSAYSADLSEFPLDTKQVNYSAQALGLLDLKSELLEFLVEQMGLDQAERYTWTLRSRTGNPCPSGMSYTVIKRNFDPVTFEPSSYVNGTLYTYLLVENCTGGNPLAVTQIAVADPVPMFSVTSVASQTLTTGEYYTGLTRDDMAGLRYMYRTNNMNFENVGPGITLFTQTTNSAGGGQLLTTLDLGPFLSSLPTTDPNTLLGLYPNLSITSVATNYVLITQTNIVTSTNTLPWLPAGFVAVGVSQTVPTNFFAQRYTYTFGNIVTNHIYTNWFTINRTLNITPKPFAPAGSGLIQTNITTVNVRGIGGDFYILPPGVAGYVFLPGMVVTNRGSIVTTTDFLTDSNGTAVVQQQVVTPSTNFSYIVYTIQLQADTNALLMQGIERMTFIRRDFDSLLGKFFQPVTNSYTLTSIANSALVTHPVQRVVNAPDILITASDQNAAIYTRSVSFDQRNILPSLAGPGVINTPATLTINKDVPVYSNVANGDEAAQSVAMWWGSFNGTTNPPILYPSGTSIVNLENQVLMHVTSTVLPNGTNNVAYNGAGFQMIGAGGSPPYTWTVVGNTLPPGLAISPDGIISGTPTSSATFDFTVRMTDIGARSVEQPLSITIHP